MKSRRPSNDQKTECYDSMPSDPTVDDGPTLPPISTFFMNLGSQIISSPISNRSKNRSRSESKEMIDNQNSVLSSYSIRFIGSTTLRKPQTYPMLNWILTDLIYQSKCIGVDLAVSISNCLKQNTQIEREEKFQVLKQQLGNECEREEADGLSVRFEIVTKNQCSNQTCFFRVHNEIDGRNLLEHGFSRIFLLNKYNRQPCYFFYVHKPEEDVINALPTIYLYKANNPIQVSGTIATKKDFDLFLYYY